MEIRLWANWPSTCQRLTCAGIRLHRKDTHVATPRKRQICLDQTLYYHCVSRCVRRAFLCGVDKVTGRSFEHRRQQIEARLHHLATIFAIDVAAYAVMSNHYHVVLRVNPEEVATWEDAEICERWRKLFKLPLTVQRFLDGERMEPLELDAARAQVGIYRERMTSISWFMKCLNTDIARAANREDDCTGRFFEGRFKCQALLDEAALLKCMAYVDLNPVRAGVAPTAEAATHTSLAHRIATTTNVLLPFAVQSETAAQESSSQHPFGTECIPFPFDAYCELVAWTAQHVHSKGTATPPPLLRAVDINPGAWQLTMQNGGLERTRVLGALKRIREFASAIGQAWMRGPQLRTPDGVLDY